MFFFKKKKKPQRDISEYKSLLPKIDIHSHLIPGIDDGAQSPEETLTLIRKLQEMGYEKAVTTPHIYFGMFPNSEEKIKEEYNKINDLLKKQNIDFSLQAAAEYFLEDEVLKKVKNHPENLLTFGKKEKFLLFEMSPRYPSVLLREFVLELRKNNIVPVLAHPARYSYVWGRTESLKEWKAMGIRIQANLNSFTATYGGKVKETALEIARKGLIDFLGTDTHYLKHLESIEKVLANPKILSVIFDNNNIRNNEWL